MNTKIAALTSVLLTAPLVTLPISPAQASLIDDVELHGTVIINIPAEAGVAPTHGTGFAISSEGGVTTIMTARHVVAQGHPVVIDSDANVHKVLTVDTGYADDRAVLTVSGFIQPVKQMSFGDMDQHVRVVGHPGQKIFAVSDGKLVYHYGSSEGNRAGQYVIQCSTCTQGDSGAAVFDDRGEAVGIVSAEQVDNTGPTGFDFILPLK